LLIAQASKNRKNISWRFSAIKNKTLCGSSFALHHRAALSEHFQVAGRPTLQCAKKKDACSSLAAYTSLRVVCAAVWNGAESASVCSSARIRNTAQDDVAESRSEDKRLSENGDLQRNVIFSGAKHSTC
jgi:hypothetical protein